MRGPAAHDRATTVLKADLVLEGGGIKGIALVGAIAVLEERGYAFNRIAGTSAGSVVGSLVAGGMSSRDIVALMRCGTPAPARTPGWSTAGCSRTSRSRSSTFLATWDFDAYVEEHRSGTAAAAEHAAGPASVAR